MVKAKEVAQNEGREAAARYLAQGKLFGKLRTSVEGMRRLHRAMEGYFEEIDTARGKAQRQHRKRRDAEDNVEQLRRDERIHAAAAWRSSTTVAGWSFPGELRSNSAP